MERVKPEIMETVNSKLRTLIEKAGSITAFAQSIGVSRDLVNNWLFGRSDIRLNDLVSISKKYNVSTDYLLGFAKYQTVSEDEKTVIKITGLSEQAVANICTLKSKNQASSLVVTNGPAGSDIIDSFSRLLENQRFISLLYDLWSMDVAASDVISLADSVEFVNEEQLKVLRLLKFEITKKFSYIVDELFPTDHVIHWED